VGRAHIFTRMAPFLEDILPTERSKGSGVYIFLMEQKLKLFGKTMKSKVMVKYFTKMAIILKVPLILHKKKEEGYISGTN